MNNIPCSCCIIPPELDPDLFNGLQFCETIGSRRTNRILHKSPCAGEMNESSSEPLEEEPIEATGADLFSEERRNVVARGMKRFEIEKFPPPQPDFEVLSKRVCCVLGQNPSPFTLNGTNCYLIGTGKKRILVDAGERDRGLHEFMRILEDSLKNLGCTGLEAILVTHLHGDHFGGCDALLEKYGPIPVLMLRCPDWQLSLFTMFALRQKGLTEYVEKGPKPRNPDGTWNEFTEADLPEWPNEDLSWDPAGRTKVEIQRDYFFMKSHLGIETQPNKPFIYIFRLV